MHSLTPYFASKLQPEDEFVLKRNQMNIVTSGNIDSSSTVAMSMRKFRNFNFEMDSYCGEKTPDQDYGRTEDKFNLPNFKVPFEFREPYILTGYRKPEISAQECLQSSFSRCNETINVWSHLVAFAFVLVRSMVVLSEHNPLEDPFAYPMISFVVGTSAMFLMSSGAHLFNSMSSKTRHVCFFFDYAAISVYAFSAGQAFYFYSRPLKPDWVIFRSYPSFVALCTIVSCVSLSSCCASRHRWIGHKFLIRTGTFMASFFINTSPYWVRMWDCQSDMDCNAVSIPYFKRQALFFAIAALANGSRLPERLMPGVFDFCGQSHHFLHILCAIGTVDEFTALYLDMLGRRKALELSHVTPTFANSLLLTTVVLVANVAIVLWFTRAIKSNDTACKKKT